MATTIHEPPAGLAAEAAEEIAVVLRALADPLRLRIVSALLVAADGRLAAGELGALTDLTPPTVSHHLRALREAGVLLGERRGTSIRYALAPGMDRVAGSLMDAVAAAHAAPPARAGRDDGSVDDRPGPDLESHLDAVTDRLHAEVPDLPRETVLTLVRESAVALARTARITQHLPVLAERFARQRLADLRRDGDPRPHVLFVCVANAGRSQLAAALLRRELGDAVVVRSAGSAPAADVHASVRPFLDPLLADVDPDDHPFPKPLTDDAVRAADVVITMGCGDTCPVLPGVRYEDWVVGDPALASAEGVAAVYADLEARVRRLAAELGGR